MRTYRVKWEIDIETDDEPPTAARQALAMQRDPESTATVFTVTWTDTLGDAYGTEQTSTATFDVEPDPAGLTADAAGSGGESRCVGCVGLGWILAVPDGDDSRAWIEIHDDCSAVAETDRDGAVKAAAFMSAWTGRTVAVKSAPPGHPGNDEHPYLGGVSPARVQAAIEARLVDAANGEARR